MHTTNWACKLSYYLRYSSKLVSAWVTVTIVIERLIIVALPLKVRPFIQISIENCFEKPRFSWFKNRKPKSLDLSCSRFLNFCTILYALRGVYFDSALQWRRVVACRRTGDRPCWRRHYHVSGNYCGVCKLSKLEEELIAYFSLFWFVVCVATVHHWNPARPPLGGHREVCSMEEIALAPLFVQC